MRTAFLLGVLVCIIFIAPTSALAIFGFGAHGGLDLYTVDSDSLTFELKYGASASLVREEIDSPLMFGGRFYIDVLPIIDLELSADVAVKTYDFTFTREVPGSTPEVTEEEATFGRIGIYATVRKDLMSFPPIVNVVTVYAGAGLGLHLVTPVASPQLFIDELTSASEKVDIDEYVKKATKVGIHALLGVRVKPPMVPLAIDAQAKYTRMPEGDYEEPNAFPSVYVGLLLDF